MTSRIYLMPITGSGATIQDARRPKYASLLTGYQMIDYGPEPYCIVGSDVTAAQHTAVMANSDVRAVPTDLDSTITSAARNAIVNAFNVASIPSGWVVVGMTYRELVRRLIGIFRFVQAIQGRGFRFLMNNLDATVSELSQATLLALQSAAMKLELSTTGFTVATTVRQILTSFGQQFANRPAIIKGIEV